MINSKDEIVSSPPLLQQFVNGRRKSAQLFLRKNQKFTNIVGLANKDIFGEAQFEKDLSATGVSFGAYQSSGRFDPQVNIGTQRKEIETQTSSTTKILMTKSCANILNLPS